MYFIVALVDGLLTPRTSFIVLTVLTLREEMGCIPVDFNCLLTFIADQEHRAGIVEVQISIIFILESLIEAFTKLTHIFRI